jgi:hypothetical protein
LLIDEMPVLDADDIKTNVPRDKPDPNPEDPSASIVVDPVYPVLGTTRFCTAKGIKFWVSPLDVSVIPVVRATVKVS